MQLFQLALKRINVRGGEFFGRDIALRCPDAAARRPYLRQRVADFEAFRQGAEQGRSFPGQVVSLGLALLASALAYFAACRVLGVRELRALLSLRSRLGQA